LPRVAVSEAILDGGKERFAPGKARVSFAKNILANTATASVVRMGKDPDRRIKILFVFDLITEWEGGTERQVRLLIQSLDRKYFEPKLCFMFKAPELAAESLPCPLLVVCPGSSRVSPAARLWRLTRLFRQERPDIVQCFFIEGLMMGILAGRVAKVPSVIGSTRNAGYWRTESHRLIMKAITPLAHRWQTNSRYLWRFQKDREGVPEDLIEILPNGMDLSGFKPASAGEKQCSRKKLGLNPEGPICVSVANLAKVKDLFTLINGAALLADRLPSIQFVLVGDGPLRDELELHAECRGVSKNIKFVGRHADVRPFLAAADVGVLTSTSEGSSNAVLEYVAMGLPVVLTDIEPNRELVDCVFFQSGDAADFATKLLSLCTDLAQQSHSKIENRKNLTQFSVENMVMRAESFYVRLVTAAQE
jgi:L-malate glycosyltransferase